MPLEVNGKAVAHARSLISAGKVNDGPWSFSAEDGDKLLGAGGDDWAAYAAAHLAVDTDAPEETKAHYKYPCIKGSEVYRRGVAAAESRAAQNGADAVAAAAKGLMEQIQERDGKSSGRPIERKSLDFEVKDFKDDGHGSADFYFAAFNNVDRANERIVPGAFKNIPEFLRDGFIAVGHDWGSLPIGIPTAAVQDAKGLLVSFKFHSHPQAQAARAVMKERIEAGKSVKGSIGYEVLEDAQVDGVRELKSLALYEGSIVNVPCNPAADAVAVKGLSAKAGRVLSRANHATLSGHVEAGTKALDEMGACLKAMAGFLAQHTPLAGTADDPDDDGDDDGATDAALADAVGFPIPAPGGTRDVLPKSHANHGATRADAVAASLVARSEETVAAFAEITTALAKQHATRSAEGRSLGPAKWDALKGLIDAAAALYAARTAEAGPEAKDAPAAAAPEPDWAAIYRQAAESLGLLPDA